MAELLLHVQGVSKSFPGVKALEDMHLDLRAGEVLALVGENGAGKSTLMKLLSGVYDADEGEFFLNGEPYEPISPKHAQELGISIIHQEFNLMPDLTVAQNIFIGREPRGSRLFLSERRLNAQARELIERLHLPLRPKQLVGNLTVAKQQMVEIGKALSYDAEAADHGRADRGAQRRRGRGPARPHPPLREARHRRHLHLAPHGRAQADRRPHHGHPRRPLRRHARHQGDDHEGGHLHDGRPRDLRRGASRSACDADREVVLEVSGLSTKELLKDVSFELRKGEILGFAGLMGAGRTEVARAVVGADRIDGGTIKLRGREIRIHTPADAAKHRIGYLSEDRKQFGLLLEQEVNANIGLSALAERFQSWGFVKDRAMRATSREYVDTLRIKTPSVAQTAKNLSGGNQQKVVIAKWLVKDCDILIFDEPTRGIDVGAKEEIYRLLNELAQQGKSIIMISSELPEVLRMSHRIVVMSEGRVTGTLDAGEATQESVMHYATLRPDENPEDAAELGLVERRHDDGSAVSSRSSAPPSRPSAPASGTGCSSSSPSRA